MARKWARSGTPKHNQTLSRVLKASRESGAVIHAPFREQPCRKSAAVAASSAIAAVAASPQVTETSPETFVGAGARSWRGAGDWQQAMRQCAPHLPLQQHVFAPPLAAAEGQSPPASKHGDNPLVLKPANRLATSKCRKIVE
jgi:hypothetical protein